MLKVQIKSKYPGIWEADQMVKCMNFFKDQFQYFFQSNDDSSMNSAKQSKDNDYVIEGEGKDQDEINFNDLDNQEKQMIAFWALLNDDLSQKKERGHQWHHFKLLLKSYDSSDVFESTIGFLLLGHVYFRDKNNVGLDYKFCGATNMVFVYSLRG